MKRVPYFRDKTTGALIFSNPEKEREIVFKRTVQDEIRAMRNEINSLRDRIKQLEERD